LSKSDIVERDNEIILGYLKSKDIAYLGQLYETYKEIIFLHSLKIVGNQEDAEDLASETFLKAFCRIEDFKTGAPFSPWLTRIATNLCIDHLRRKNRHKFYNIDESYMSVAQKNDPNPKEPPISERRIIDVLRKLKPVQKRCLCLFYIHNRTYKQIAELTGYPLGKVRSYIQNGRRNFKILMEKE